MASKILIKVTPKLTPLTQPPTSVYYGEAGCTAQKKDHQQCTNKAYYIGLLCGTHSKDKVALPKNPQTRDLKERNVLESKLAAERAAVNNRAAGRGGMVILHKMHMMRSPECQHGYLMVFPNHRHGARKDGLGMPSLSPKSLGPATHGQPGLPAAKNLENLHQGNKVFSEELLATGNPCEEFYKRQRAMYLDAKPYRHKFEKYTELARNVPKYSVWIDGDGTERHLSYFESRQIYCNLYEAMIQDSPDFKHLQDILRKGYNIQICGYDAYEVAGTEHLDACYRDTTRPFGHELVLYCMLMESQPWARHTFLTNIHAP